MLLCRLHGHADTPSRGCQLQPYTGGLLNLLTLLHDAGACLARQDGRQLDLIHSGPRQHALPLHIRWRAYNRHSIHLRHRTKPLSLDVYNKAVRIHHIMTCHAKELGT